MFQDLAKFLILLGAIIAVIGIMILILGKLGFKGLPGDIFVKKDNFVFYFPIVTSILLSILLSIVFTLISIFLSKK